MKIIQSAYRVPRRRWSKVLDDASSSLLEQALKKSGDTRTYQQRQAVGQPERELEGCLVAGDESGKNRQ
jgi:hypothetical protein